MQQRPRRISLKWFVDAFECFRSFDTILYPASNFLRAERVAGREVRRVAGRVKRKEKARKGKKREEKGRKGKKREEKGRKGRKGNNNN
jgi:hypothetical protein